MFLLYFAMRKLCILDDVWLWGRLCRILSMYIEPLRFRCLSEIRMIQVSHADHREIGIFVTAWKRHSP